MLKKIKFAILSMSTLFTLGLPMAVAGVATAQVGQGDINSNLCSGSDINFTSTGSNANCGTNADTTVNSLLKTVINIISVVVGVIAVIMIIIGGFRYITSGGKQESVTGAKNTILYAIVGLVIVALAQIIVHFVLSKTSAAAPG